MVLLLLLVVSAFLVIVVLVIVIVVVVIPVLLLAPPGFRRHTGPYFLPQIVCVMSGSNVVGQIFERPPVIEDGRPVVDLVGTTLVGPPVHGCFALQRLLLLLGLLLLLLLLLLLGLLQTEFFVGLGLDLGDLPPDIDAAGVVLEAKSKVYTLGGVSFFQIWLTPRDDVIALPLVGVS